MRICFIDAAVGTLTGGTESIIYNLGLELSQRHEITLITGSSKKRDILPHIRNAPFKLIAIPFISRLEPENENIRSRFHLPLQFDVEAISLFLSFLRSKEACSAINNCDVVSFHYPMVSLLFSWYLKIKGIPSVFHTPGHVTGKWFFRFDRSTLFLSNSYETERKIYQFTGHHADGVVTPGIIPPEAYPKKNLDSKCPILLNVSRLTYAKGIYRLLNIFHYLKMDLPQARLLLVGKNYEGQAIIDKIDELGLKQNVVLEGQVSYFEVSKYYAKADLFIHPSYPESFGMVLLEAMSYGLPVVATNLPAFREASCGVAVLLPYEESQIWSGEIYLLWAKEILKLLQSPEKMRKMSEEGKAIAIQQTWNKKAAEYENFLQEAIKLKLNK